ncbi:MAG: class I SAM-dependent methyltransferase [Methylococcaceae bacterium]|nr:class I SAM-dependent methyltransferase [Methylococcaceae bacterium]
MKISSILANPRLYELSQLCSRGTKYAKIFFEDYIRPQSGHRILEIGCGTGLIFKYLRRFYPACDCKYVGFDISETYVRFAKRRYGNEAEFYCRRVTPEGLLDFGKFDTVISAGVVHHLSNDEALNLFATARSALKEGGQFIALEPCYKNRQSPFVRWLLDNDPRWGHYCVQRDVLGYLTCLWRCSGSWIHDA